MQTEEDEVPITYKKKNDKGQHLNDTVGVDKTESLKKAEKSDSDDPKPRIVLTFRSEKSGARHTNMKIVPNDEKHDEVSPRRSSRTRNKWEWSDDAETSASPNKEKNSSQSVSENDETTSDSCNVSLKRSSRRRSKDTSENIIANAIARKEKSYNETAGPTQRLSRRIKPTAKILANKELRIGLESQNNARLGIQAEKSEAGVKTRRSGRSALSGEPAQSSKATKKEGKVTSDTEDDNSNSVDKGESVKVKHLCGLGLKAIDQDSNYEEDEEEEEEEDEEDLEVEEEGEDEDEMEGLDDEEIDDDSEEVISKLLEADEDSSEDFSCSVGKPQRIRPRRSTRLCSTYIPDGDEASASPDNDDQKEHPKRSSVRRSARSCNYTNDRDYSPPRKKSRSSRRSEQRADEVDDTSRSRRLKNRSAKEDAQSEADQEDNNSEPAEGEDTAEATCPEDESAIVATCYCEETSNLYPAPGELKDPVFCQAVETVEGVRVGCSHAAGRASTAGPLRRAGPRAPYRLHCRLHAALLPRHMCCPACGIFCTQGVFYQCSKGHLFHLECGLPYGEKGAGCPHCGVRAYRWLPVNSACSRVRVDMHCSNQRILLPDQREQCTPAYLSFPRSESPLIVPDDSPLIPEDLLPSPPLDLQMLTQQMESGGDEDDISSVVDLFESILALEPMEQLIPKIMRSIASIGSMGGEKLSIDKGGATALCNVGVGPNGQTLVHAACRSGHVAALHLLQCIGADLDAADNNLKTPLMVAIQTLYEKAETKINKSINDDDSDKEEPQDMEMAEDDLPLKSESTKIEEVENEVTEDEKFKEVNEEKVEQGDESEDIMESNDGQQKENDVIQKTDIDIKEEMDVKTEPDSNKDGLFKVIRYLIAAGCDLNKKGPEGMTALHVAAQLGAETACSLLLAGGADVDPRDLGGWTPLVWAAENSHVGVVRVLAGRGADCGGADAEGNGAVHWCAARGGARALPLLLAAAPHALHHQNTHRDTPLHVAARQGHYACVLILLARGARTDIENAAGELPVEVGSGAVRAAIALSMQLSPSPKRRLPPIANDISNGREPFPIPCVNEVDDTPPPTDFTYVTQNVLPEPLDIDNTLQTMQGCSCVDDCSSDTCACAVLSVRHWMQRGRLVPSFPYHDPPMLFECNQTCACNARTCSNRTVSRIAQAGSVGVRVQVFRSARRGFGVRVSERAARGTPLALYRGELLRAAAADARADDCHVFALGLKPDLAQQCSDKSLLCLDARHYGSVARFVNHSCRPSAVPLRVFSAARDLRLPDVALTAATELRPGDEITFDYGDKFWSVKSKFMKCECGMPECRYPEKTPDSD